MSCRRGFMPVTARAVTGCVLAIWAATLAGALPAIAGLRMVSGHVPEDALAATPRTALALFVHNAPVAMWPLALVAIGWPALAGARVFGDVLVAGQLVSHGLLVGPQIAQYPELWRYLPHLPVEWVAIAVPAAAWLRARTLPLAQGTDLRGLAVLASACLVALVHAALIETYLVPVT